MIELHLWGHTTSFACSTAKEMASWIARINLAAATHSAPSFSGCSGLPTQIREAHPAHEPGAELPGTASPN